MLKIWDCERGDFYKWGRKDFWGNGGCLLYCVRFRIVYRKKDMESFYRKEWKFVFLKL